MQRVSVAERRSSELARQQQCSWGVSHFDSTIRHSSREPDLPEGVRGGACETLFKPGKLIVIRLGKQSNAITNPQN